MKIIGSGADGQVFEKDGKALKYSVFSQSKLDTIKLLSEINPRAYVYVYECGKNNDDDMYVLMDKLDACSEDEVRVFHSVLSHEDRNLNKCYTEKQLINILSGLSKGLDFDSKEVLKFCLDVKECKFVHLDLHPRNIMKKNNHFKLIDLDRIRYEKD